VSWEYHQSILIDKSFQSSSNLLSTCLLQALEAEALEERAAELAQVLAAGPAEVPVEVPVEVLAAEEHLLRLLHLLPSPHMFLLQIRPQILMPGPNLIQCTFLVCAASSTLALGRFLRMRLN
jgi:hypothetical protein